MSRTDKTRPWWVRMADEPMRTCRPAHDHRDGHCTLPPDITRATESMGHVSTMGCHWRATDFYLHAQSGGSDGCRDCTGYYERRADRRRTRHESRRELREYRGRPPAAD
ncbi:hypothetical protein [Amycolatopsis jejuensis]|uniref:hypothetical protein n=1 Tax=Amycolatopsis jejuensis TaxID=330084 RepID=UPI0005278669|nr:hypothetical protein [Amycolatopsis jejuensis]